MMLLSKGDRGETLKAEIRALREKYGGFQVDFMNKVCQIEDGDSGDPEPSPRGHWNINWPDVNLLSRLYTANSHDEKHRRFIEGKSFNDNYEPDPAIFLWTIKALMAKPPEADRPFIIGSDTTPKWTKILTSNLSERDLSKVLVDLDSKSHPTSLGIWVRESKVMTRLKLSADSFEDDVFDSIAADVIRQNRVKELSVYRPGPFLKLLPSLNLLNTMTPSALDYLKISNSSNDMGPATNGILQSLTGLGSIRRLILSIKSRSETLDFFVDQFLSHPDCRVDDVDVWWKTDDGTIESSPISSGVTLLEADYLLKMVRTCPTIRRLNYYDPRIWRYESNMRQRMVSFFIALEQNQVGRGFVLDPSCYRTPSSHGIFSHLLDRAYNSLDPRKGDYDYIQYEQYEEGVDHHHQDHPYDGIYYMIKELAGRGVLGIDGDISEEDECCKARPSKICKH